MPYSTPTVEQRMRNRLRTAVTAASVGVLALAGVVAGQLPAASAAPTPAAVAAATPDSPADPSTVAPEQRAAVLPAGWSGSSDLAWTTDGDAQGFHLLVAEQSTGYTWRTAATLSEPGVDTDRWIGNACVTGSGRRAIVVYAPRQFTNRAQLFDRGAFSAVVDLVTGKVTKLGLGTTLAYFNPGCGTGETAVLTQGGQDLGKTRMYWLDSATGKLPWHAELDGQVTSGVPVGDKIVAVGQPGLVQVDQTGKPSTYATGDGAMFDVHPDQSGGVVYLEQHGTDTAVARQAHAGAAADLASGPLTSMKLSAGTGGRVFLSGKPASVGKLPAGVSTVDAPMTAELSTQGQLAVTYDTGRGGQPAVNGTSPAGSEESSPIKLNATVLPTGKQVTFSMLPGMRPSQYFTDGAKPALAATPASPTGPKAAAVGSPTDPVDADRTCALPRNDVNMQIYQPHWNQVEWAADLAVAHQLNISRAANWKNAGMSSSWSPQGLFPPGDLTGGGSVPPQILLGVLSQESNLWQASSHVVEGESGNPLVGSFYGQTFSGTDGWAINFANADCGYGIGQITDGMRITDTSLSAAQKRGLTVDYATNIAASLRILISKWNQTKAAGISINDGSPAWLENWSAAVWAYNTGMQPNAANGNTTGCTPSASCTDGSGNWGLGYTNNPANGSYPRNRAPFLEVTQDDARNPQLWPYQEKVLGWAAYPIIKVEITDPGNWHAAYAQAWWISNDARFLRSAPYNTFCTTGDDHCDYSKSEACTLSNFHCWWHKSVTYKDCSSTSAACGHSTSTYAAGSAEPAGAEGRNYPPHCGTGGLPSNALVIDDLANSVPTNRACSRPTNAGSFGLSFAADSSGKYRSKSDFHQVGAGYGDHFWFAHTRLSTDNSGTLQVTGTWTFSASQSGWGRVLVHLPDHGAQTQQARYDIDLGNGAFSKFRIISQGTEENKWVSLGVYKFAGTPKVRLTNVTQDGYGSEDVAWDAVAVQPLGTTKPKHIVAALGDSYSSGEGAGNYYRETDDNHGTTRWAACRRSRNAWPRKMVLPGTSSSAGSLSDAWSSSVELGFFACSGAYNWQVQGDGVPFSWTELDNYQKGDGEFREISQINSGVLDENTTLVTLSIGGNDAGFSDAVVACGNLTNCANDSSFLSTYEGKIDAVQTDTMNTIRKIAGPTKAKNAQIVLMGYPELLSRTVKCAGSWYYDGTEAQALAVLANYMATKEQASVNTLKGEGIKVDFANPIPAFVGHGGCDDPEWINKIVIGPNGDGDFHNGDKSSPFCFWEILGGNCLSRESFHPKDAGTTGYAQVMQSRLAAIGYTGS
jgi:hypothetical protein